MAIALGLTLGYTTVYQKPWNTFRFDPDQSEKVHTQGKE